MPGSTASERQELAGPGDKHGQDLKTQPLGTREGFPEEKEGGFELDFEGCTDRP